MAYDPGDPEVQRKVANGELVFNPSTGQIEPRPQGAPAGTYYTAPNQNPQVATTQTAPIGNPVQQQYNAQQGVYNAQGQLINANQGVINAQQGVIPLSQAAIDAQRASNQAQIGVLNATQNTFGPAQAVIDAKGNVINQQTGYIQAQQGFIGQQQAANTASIGDTNAIIQARGNTADQVAVARQQQEYRDIYDKRAAAAGVSAPIRVATSSNAAGPLAPGVIGDVRTQEARVTELANDRATARGQQLEGARLALSLLDTNVKLAEQQAARVGLTLDQAKLLVDQESNKAGYARIAANNAGLNVDQAQLGVERARLDAATAGIGVNSASLALNRSLQPPAAGLVLYQDPVTGQGQWVTPAVADNLKRQYERDYGVANASTRYSDSGLGGLSEAEVLSGVNDGTITEGMAYQELINRGYSPQQVDLKIAGARKKVKAGGGFDEGDLNGTSTATTAPVSNALPGTAAPGSPAYNAAVAYLAEMNRIDIANAGYQ